MSASRIPDLTYLDNQTPLTISKTGSGNIMKTKVRIAQKKQHIHHDHRIRYNKIQAFLTSRMDSTMTVTVARIQRGASSGKDDKTYLPHMQGQGHLISTETTQIQHRVHTDLPYSLHEGINSVRGLPLYTSRTLKKRDFLLTSHHIPSPAACQPSVTRRAVTRTQHTSTHARIRNGTRLRRLLSPSPRRYGQ